MTGAPDKIRTLRIGYRIAAVDFGPTGLVYRCRAVKRTPGWSAMVLPSHMVPPGVVAGDTVEVTVQERRRRFLGAIRAAEKTIIAVRRI
jgi:hypothetical protein